MRWRRDLIAVGIALLAMAPLGSAMRSVAGEEWASYLLYVIAGLGLVGAGWSWHKQRAQGVRLGLAGAAVALLARFVLSIGSGAGPYFLVFGIWAAGSFLGAAWTWRRVEAGTALVVGVSGAVYASRLFLTVRDGVLLPTVFAGDILGIVGALLAFWGWSARGPPPADLM